MCGRRNPSTASGVTLAILAEIVRALQQSGEVIDAVPAETLGWLLDFLLYVAVPRWLVQHESDLTAEFLQAFDMFMHGVAIDQTLRASGNKPRAVSRKSPRKNQ